MFDVSRLTFHLFPNNLPDLSIAACQEDGRPCLGDPANMKSFFADPLPGFAFV